MKKLKDLIENAVVSQREIERATGVARLTISNILKEKHQPSELVRKKLCKYFGVDWKEYN